MMKFWKTKDLFAYVQTNFGMRSLGMASSILALGGTDG